MRSLLIFAIAIIAVTACDVPKEIQSGPDNTTNTSGTTGSATVTDKPATVGTGSDQLPDSLKRKRDSLP